MAGGIANMEGRVAGKDAMGALRTPAASRLRGGLATNNWSGGKLPGIVEVTGRFDRAE